MPESYITFTFQTRTLTFAAMDTTSNALSRTLSILAAHPEVQDRVRQEILDALEKNEGQDLSYDELVSLPFLDAVCRETLRL
jgi:cytochrome P450